MTTREDLQTKLYDSIAAFTGVACWNVLQYAQNRQYLAEHLAEALAPELPAGFEQKTCVTVKCAVCGYPYDEAEFVMHFPSAEEAANRVTSDGWDELKDGRVLCMRGDDKHDELRNTVGVVDPYAEETPGDTR